MATLNFKDLFADNDPFKVILADYISDQTVRTEVVNLYKVTLPDCLEQTYSKVEEFIRNNWKDAYGELDDQDLFWLFHYKEKEGEQWINEDFEKHISEIVYDEKTENLEAALGIASETFRAIREEKKHLDNTIDWFNGLIDYAGEVETYVSVNDDFKTVLAKMCDHLSVSSDTDRRYQTQLRGALESYVQYNEASNLRMTMFVNYLKDTAVSTLEDFIFDNMKKEAEKWLQSVLSEKAMSAYNAIVKAADATWKVMEYVTKNGELQECREMLKANAYFEDTMYATLRSIEKDFSEKKSFKEASLFDTAFKFFKETEISSMDTVAQYLKTYQASWIAAIRNRSNTFARSAIEEVLINKLFLYKTYCHGQAYKLGGKIVMIACPTDVTIYDNEGKPVISVKEDEVTEYIDGIYAYTADAVKVVALPNDQEFRVKIDATDDGVMSYTVSEYDSDMQNVRKVEYTDVQIKKGESYTGTIAGEIGGEAEKYDLVDKDKEPLGTGQILDANTYVPLKSISINTEIEKVAKGDTLTLEVSVSPQNTTEQTYVWSSSDEKIISVDEKGRVKALSPGKATITVHSLNGGLSSSVDIVCEDKGDKEDISEQIKQIMDTLGTYAVSDVKSTDKDAIARLAEEIDGLLVLTSLTSEERSTLTSIKNKTQELITRIDEAAHAINTDNIKSVSGIRPDNVKLENKDALENAKSDLEKALKDKPNNYTDTEKQTVSSRIQEINDALQVIRNVENVMELIEALPAADKITASDTETVTNAKAAYNSLADYEKTLVAAQSKDKLDASIAALEKVDADDQNRQLKIEQIRTTVNKYEILTVKSENQEEITRLSAEIDELLKAENLSDDDITELNGLKMKCQNLISRISDVSDLIRQLLDAVDSYDKETIKSTDQKALEQIITDIGLLTDTGNLTIDEKNKLTDAKEKAQGFITVIQYMAAAAETENIKAASAIMKDNVKLGDKKILQDAKLDLEGILKNNPGNYTDLEKEKFKRRIEEIDDALKVIENVERVIGLINALPDCDKITVSNTDIINQAETSYKSLTDYEKTLIDEETKSKLDLSVSALKDIEKGQKDENADKTENGPGAIAAVKTVKIRLSGVSKKIAAGKKIKLVADIMPSNATNKAVAWTSSNKKVAVVNSAGVVTMKKKSGGKSVTITATAQDGSGVKATYKIKSMKGVVKKVTISGRKSVQAGKTLKLKAKAKATKKANKKLQWISSNKKYATVNKSGKVKTSKAGKGKKVKITAMATDGSGKKKSITIRIK